jgi:hypothetical protein
MKFKELSRFVQHIHLAFARQAGRSVNTALTLRNWLIGFYIKEYEQAGKDRSKYGVHLIETLANDLQKEKIPSVSERSLKQYRQFYDNYPSIGQAASAQLQELIDQHIFPVLIGQMLPAQSFAKKSFPFVEKL